MFKKVLAVVAAGAMTMGMAILIWGVLIFGVVAAMIALIFTKRKWKEERGTRQ